MSQSLRQAQNAREPDNKGSNPLASLSQLLLLVITLACGGIAYYWLSSDITGEYIGQNDQLGEVTIAITRKPASIVGDFTYGREQPTPITESQVKPNGQIALRFQQASSGFQSAGAIFQGKLTDGILKGSLYLDGAQYQLSLERNPLATLHRRIQAILP